MKQNFPADTTSLFPVREFVRSRALGIDLNPQEVNDIVLAVSDACALLLRHSLDTSIVLGWEAGTNEIVITVEDTDEIRVWAEEGRISSEETSLISDLVDEVFVQTIKDTGHTVIRMSKRLGSRRGI
jgi:anti-sigma regulatory factor (Ser/Thr protein kinase)